MVARGGTLRNPWKRSPTHSIVPREGSKQESVAPRGALHLFRSLPSRGCAALHPLLPSIAPPGLLRTPPNYYCDCGKNEME
jgi:hypothetical protein